MPPFTPQSLPIHSLDFARLAKAIGDANCKLARYSGLLEAQPLWTQVLRAKEYGAQRGIDLGIEAISH